MQDTIIKGTGNSRTLGSVPNFLTLYPTYEAFATALINKQLPIDLGPMNPAGVQTAGTDLNKENLLKDATAALYGLPATAVPDQVLSTARNLISAAQAAANGRVQIAVGSYVGTGSSLTQAAPKTLNFGFKPLFVQIAARYNNDSAEISITSVVPQPTAMIYSNSIAALISSNINDNLRSYFGVTWSNTDISFFEKDGANRLNSSQYTYYYCAFG